MTEAVEAALGELHALCGGSFGPCGAHTLLFRPPEAPVITGSGYALLSAWREALDAQNTAQSASKEGRAVARFVLSAMDGLHREVGDGASELVLLLHAFVTLAPADKTHRRQLSLALGALKWSLLDELSALGDQGAAAHGQLRIPVDIELKRPNDSEGSMDVDERLQPTGEFRRRLLSVLQSALSGLFGLDTCEFIVELVVEWLFRSPWTSAPADDKAMDARRLLHRVEAHLKRAPDTIMFLTSPSLRTSNVLPPDDFILRQSIVAAQQHLQMTQSPVGSMDAVRFVCITCPLSLSAGANHVTVAVPHPSTRVFTDWMAPKDSAKLFLSRYIRELRATHGVRLLICTERIKEDVVATCTRFGVSCVEFAEPDEVSALGIASGTTALTNLFDPISEEIHVAQCYSGIATLRLQHRPCLRLCGIGPSTPHCDREGERPQSLYRHRTVVPQLLLHAPSKGVYKQYYAGVIKALRVLRSWFKSPDRESPSRLYVCRGAGATELAIARLLHAAASPDREKLSMRDRGTLETQRLVADALLGVVTELQQNLHATCGDGGVSSSGARRHTLALLAMSSSDCGEPHNEDEAVVRSTPAPLYVLDQRHRIETQAGAIACPQLVRADPEDVGLVHPWPRMEALLFQMLSTLEQLFRVDAVLHIKRGKAPGDRGESEDEDAYG